MQDTGIVVSYSKRSGSALWNYFELARKSSDDVLIKYTYILVSVDSWLFVEEAESMTYFMNHNWEVYATSSKF